MKKTLTFIIIILMIFSLSDTCFVNAATIYKSGDFKFVVANSKARIVEYTGENGILTIPLTLTHGINYSVYGVEECAFEDCEKITEVNGGKSSLVIMSCAFRGSVNLEKIDLKAQEIKSSAFSNCKALTDVKLSFIKNIHTNAFKECNNLKTISISKSVSTIYENAFNGCSSLQDVYYDGTLEQKNNIIINSGNDALVNANWHFVQCENNGHTYADIYDAECNVCGTAKNGNINNDEIINNKDLAILMQYINGWNVSVVKKKADVNCDGFINNKDYVILMRYINGWNIKLD